MFIIYAKNEKNRTSFSSKKHQKITFSTVFGGNIAILTTCLSSISACIELLFDMHLWVPCRFLCIKSGEISSNILPVMAFLLKKWPKTGPNFH